MDSLILRKATLQDYEAVMAIHGNVYHGLDYLPDFYKRYITYTHMASYVAENEGGVVAYCLAHVNDGETSLIMRAARVKPTHQGQGILSKLKEYLKQEELRKYPNLRKVKITVCIPLEGNAKLPSNYEEIFRRKLYCFQQKTSYISKILSSNSKNFTDRVLRKLTAGDLQTILGSEKNNSDLFPNGIGIINWVPYATLGSNGSIIEAESDVYASYEDQNQTSTKRTVFLCAVTNIMCEGVRLRAGMDMFGTNIDASTIKKHIFYHVYKTASKAKELGIENVHVEFHTEEKLCKKVLMETASELGLQPSIGFFGASENYVYLLEANI